jgi:hypothetical protein
LSKRYWFSLRFCARDGRTLLNTYKPEAGNDEWLKAGNFVGNFVGMKAVPEF